MATLTATRARRTSVQHRLDTLQYVGIRVFQGVITLALVTLLVFVLTATLGDPVAQLLPPGASQEQYESMQALLGYDKPVFERYLDYNVGLLHADLGQSAIFQRPNTDLILERLAVSATIAVGALAIAIIVGVPLGILAGAKPGTAWDRLSTLLATGGQVIPTFLIAILLTYLFSLKLQIFPVAGAGSWGHFVLPSLALSFWVMAAITRLTRSGMREALSAPFITMATAKGIGPMRVTYGHAARHALLPVVTYGGLQLGTLLSGTVIIEAVYGMPGLGKLAIDAVEGRDFQLVQAIVLVSAVLYVLITLLVDLLYTVIDPRVRVGRG